MKTAQLDRQHLEDILVGATFLGSGGGGPRRIGQQIIDSLIEAGTLPKLVALEDLPADAWGAVSAFAGSPASVSGATFDWSPATEAFEKMRAWAQAHERPPASFVIPAELGGGNSFIPLAVAATLGDPLALVDTAGARRAVPSLTDTTFAQDARRLSPMILASADKHMHMTVAIPNPTAADDVLRAVVGNVQGFNNVAGIAVWPLTAEELTKSSIGGATSYARGLGEAIRNAPAGGKIEAALAYTQGVLLAEGTITKIDAATAGGFDHNTVEIDAGARRAVRVFSQNENLIAYSSDRAAPLCMAPDLLCYLTPEGVPFSNADPELAKGTRVALIGVPAPERMREPYFIEQFLKHLQGLGYGGSFVPVENLRG